MTEITIIGRPEFVIKLTRLQIEVLRELAAAHYSGDCKKLAGPSGELTHWRREFDLADAPEIEVRTTFRTLDLLTKVLEMRGTKLPVADALNKDFRNALSTANAYCQTWVKDVL